MTTPIDPNDSHTLTTIYNEVLDREAQYITDCLNSAEGLISQDELEGMELDRTRSAILAVARAVCPEHHAVYDTREFVLVPVESARQWIDTYRYDNASDELIEIMNAAGRWTGIYEESEADR